MEKRKTILMLLVRTPVVRITHLAVSIFRLKKKRENFRPQSSPTVLYILPRYQLNLYDTKGSANANPMLFTVAVLFLTSCGLMQ
jgi:hypothetical protein